jgi:LytS/YehU family sensor histidine kinase
MLERDKEVSELQAVQSRNLNIGIGSLFLILIVIGVLFIRQNKLNHEHKSTLLEQKLLRLQMSPHFIFNALSNIMHAIEEGSKQSALSYLSKFSKLLRTNLESSRQDYILLEDEIKSIEHYLELQQLRYEDKFDYNLETDDDIDLENAIIPPMLIQPFIENAIEHGIRHKKDKGNITIRFTRKGEKISCEIEDDGVGREKAWEADLKHKEHKSLATEIILDRIAVLNKKIKQKISLSIIDLKSDANEALGTLVRLDLPYLLD